MVEPPRWTKEELEEARARAIELFREERLTESLKKYFEFFDAYRNHVEVLLQKTSDLRNFDNALALLTDDRLFEVLRYTQVLPISSDDLEILANSRLKATRFRNSSTLVQHVITLIMRGLDHRRFPWVPENRDPSERERQAAVVASAALMAMRRVETVRRSEGKGLQERRVEEALISAGLRKVGTRSISTTALAPSPGEFCKESLLGTRKADFIVGLWDRRILPIECKVSNSSTNSIKRLNNDAAVKAVTWKKEFGELNVTPAAVLSGVYNLRNLLDAQNRGLYLFWAHDLESLTGWIRSTHQA